MVSIQQQLNLASEVLVIAAETHKMGWALGLRMVEDRAENLLNSCPAIWADTRIGHSIELPLDGSGEPTFEPLNNDRPAGLPGVRFLMKNGHTGPREPAERLHVFVSRVIVRPQAVGIPVL